MSGAQASTRNCDSLLGIAHVLEAWDHPTQQRVRAWNGSAAELDARPEAHRESERRHHEQRDPEGPCRRGGPKQAQHRERHRREAEEVRSQLVGPGRAEDAGVEEAARRQEGDRQRCECACRARARHARKTTAAATSAGA